MILPVGRHAKHADPQLQTKFAQSWRGPRSVLVRERKRCCKTTGMCEVSQSIFCLTLPLISSPHKSPSNNLNFYTE
eukprot:6212420-Pleurochrysis_carterae.AAC.2